ncbi:hypothetical protein [uncultured Bradyrhizobium sp.]|uniref:hypothetical protein n=1 Tax=uncultured Bradyrhizobium sp. TaxID=199684 RepID=UPI0035CC515D
MTNRAILFHAITLGLVGMTAFAAVAAKGQQVQVLSDSQCRDARAVTLATLKKYNGRMSAPLARSLGRFSEKCDLSIKFDVVPGTADEDAFGEFRLKITVIKTSSLGTNSLNAA